MHFRYQESNRILSASRILQDPIESNIGLNHLGRRTNSSYDARQKQYLWPIGQIDTRDEVPSNSWEPTVWCNHQDFYEFVDRTLDALVRKESGTYFVCSDNYQLWLDINDAKNDLGFVAKDGSKKKS